MDTDTVWIPDGTGVTDAGDVGGDGQVTAAYSIRYHNRDLPGAMITVSFYGEDIKAPNEYTGVARVVKHTEFMVCRDRKDPGGTEEWCDYEYVYMDDRNYTKRHRAVRRAFRMASQHTTDMIDWDGRPTW